VFAVHSERYCGDVAFGQCGAGEDSGYGHGYGRPVKFEVVGYRWRSGGAWCSGVPVGGFTGTDGLGFAAAENLYPSNLYADLSAATSATINAIRLAFQTQKLLERDARGGTRYTELVRAAFRCAVAGCSSAAPGYLGGGKTAISINPIAQTSATNLDGGATPMGNLAAMATMLGQGHGFSQSFTEHGYIIGLACVDADLTYQQGLRRHWSRSTRYDFYFPAFAMLGEQAVLNKRFTAGVTGTML